MAPIRTTGPQRGGEPSPKGEQLSGSAASATADRPFGDFTEDEEARFLASTDGDRPEAMRRLKACLVRPRRSWLISLQPGLVYRKDPGGRRLLRQFKHVSRWQSAHHMLIT